MNKKGFTLVELLAIIVVIAILGSLASVAYTKIVESGKQSVYKNYEANLEGAARDYLIQNFDAIPLVNETKTITYSELKDTYMENIKDPKGGKCDGSYVKVTRYADIGNNYNLTYKTCLMCTNYKSDGC